MRDSRGNTILKCSSFIMREDLISMVSAICYLGDRFFLRLTNKSLRISLPVGCVIFISVPHWNFVVTYINSKIKNMSIAKENLSYYWLSLEPRMCKIYFYWNLDHCIKKLLHLKLFSRWGYRNLLILGFYVFNLYFLWLF